MKRTIATLLIAVPLSIGTVAVTAGAASADPGEFTISPQPDEPKDIADSPKPDKPKGPKDKAPKPQPQPEPKPEPQPKPQPKPQPAAKPTGEKKDATPTDEAATTAASFVDKNFPPAAELVVTPVADESEGMDLAWYLVGGALITATGAAAARRIARARS